MPDAANEEHNAAGEALAQQGNMPSSSEHETSKPTDPLEIPPPNESGSRTQKHAGEGISKKGESTKSIELAHDTHVLTTVSIPARRKCKNGGIMCIAMACMPCTCGMSAMWVTAMED